MIPYTIKVKDGGDGRVYSIDTHDERRAMEWLWEMVNEHGPNRPGRGIWPLTIDYFVGPKTFPEEP